MQLTDSSMNGTLAKNRSGGPGHPPDLESLTNDDAAWALTCAFLIMTMQTGFAMLECGCVSTKNVANIMIKNVVDVSLGGMSYWLVGYGLSFGQPSNAFMGMGAFFFDAPQHTGTMGSDYSHYFFQFSFATTATTIVSGAVAERMNFHAYMAFSFFNTFVYCFPASWAWNQGVSGWVPGASFTEQTGGFLYRLRFFDYAGVCVVHVTGGVSALVAAYMVGPRSGRFDRPADFTMSSPVTALTGMFMLWWAWLGFNCGSTFGVSGDLWKVAALVAVTTLNGAIGGGVIGLSMSMARHHGKVLVEYVINSILGGLVAITGVAAVTTPAEALLIGGVGGIIAITTSGITDRLKVDDPVGAIPVHCFAATWGTLAVGLFGRPDQFGTLRGLAGLFHGGSWRLLGVQALGLLCIVMWSAATTFLMIWTIKQFIGLRMTQEEEFLGADWCEHEIKSVISESDKLQQALGKVDDSKRDEFMQRLQKELELSEGRSEHRHRLFATDRRRSYKTLPGYPPSKPHVWDGQESHKENSQNNNSKDNTTHDPAKSAKWRIRSAIRKRGMANGTIIEPGPGGSGAADPRRSANASNRREKSKGNAPGTANDVFTTGTPVPSLCELAANSRGGGGMYGSEFRTTGGPVDGGHGAAVPTDAWIDRCSSSSPLISMMQANGVSTRQKESEDSLPGQPNGTSAEPEDNRIKTGVHFL